MRQLSLWLAITISLLPALGHAEAFRFSVLMRVPEESNENSAWHTAIDNAHTNEATFIVVNGLKPSGERCSEALYQQRIDLLAQASVPVILSMAATDWAYCRDRQNRPAGLVWLNLLREKFAVDISTNSSSAITLKHQSAMPAYRSYTENARWVYDRILFATLHVAANNNQYIEAAGRNSEFEDRQVANREWIRRLAEVALREHRGAIVIFCDGNPLPAPWLRAQERDGYKDMRKHLRELAEKSGLWVLVVQGSSVDTPKTPPEIIWAERLGYVTLQTGVNTLTADLNATLPFTLITEVP
jgi:hypothetical protein